MRRTPAFAVVGAVNHGKSSVVSALAEDDRVRISDMPGETVANQTFGLDDLVVFHDTPGFQNARKALAALDDEPADDALAPFRRFVARRRDDPAFDAECRLLAPIVAGAGVVYVVDASAPLRDIHLAEMEFLRRTGAPRLAIVNRTGRDDHGDAWKSRLSQHFNIVRAFDAHRATFADRLELLEALASIERDWKAPLLEAVRVLAADRAARIADAATLILDGITTLVGLSRRAPVDASRDDATRLEAMRTDFLAEVVEKERTMHRALIALYRHHRIAPRDVAGDPFGTSLFAEETWRLLGLGTRQLVGLATVAGGVTGAGIDAATLGHSLGLGAAVGAIAGAGGALALGRRRPEITMPAVPDAVRALLPRSALRLGGRELVVGPIRAENFPWIVLDRTLGLFAAVETRSHARRDDGTIDARDLLPRLESRGLTVAHWPDAARDACRKAFHAARRGRAVSDAVRDTARDAIRDGLARIAADERIIGTPPFSPPPP